MLWHNLTDECSLQRSSNQQQMRHTVGGNCTSNQQQATFLPCKHKTCSNPHTFPQATVREEHKQTLKCHRSFIHPLLRLWGLQVRRSLMKITYIKPEHEMMMRHFVNLDEIDNLNSGCLQGLNVHHCFIWHLHSQTISPRMQMCQICQHSSKAKWKLSYTHFSVFFFFNLATFSSRVDLSAAFCFSTMGLIQAHLKKQKYPFNNLTISLILASDNSQPQQIHLKKKSLSLLCSNCVLAPAGQKTSGSDTQNYIFLSVQRCIHLITAG